MNTTSDDLLTLPGNGLARLNARLQAGSPLLYWCALVMFALSLPVLLLAGVDARLLQGVSVWLKPWKFLVSTALYLWTLALFLSLLPAAARRTRSGRYVVWAAAGAGVFELAYITWRAALGEASHFNVATPFDATMYTLMGLGAVILASAAGVLGVMLLRARPPGLAPALRWGVALGLLLGFALGTVFGAYLSGQGGHWVGGTASDAGGLAVFKWSRDGGDLRVAHFFGLHAMQLIPAVAWAAQAALREAAAVRATVAFAVFYSAFTVFTFWQALGGRPLV